MEAETFLLGQRLAHGRLDPAAVQAAPFRIWQVPYDQVEGIMGYFDPALPIPVGEFAQRGIDHEQEPAERVRRAELVRPGAGRRTGAHAT